MTKAETRQFIKCWKKPYRQASKRSGTDQTNKNPGAVLGKAGSVAIIATWGHAASIPKGKALREEFAALRQKSSSQEILHA
jgi:hypothetical protein